MPLRRWRPGFAAAAPGRLGRADPRPDAAWRRWPGNLPPGARHAHLHPHHHHQRARQRSAPHPGPGIGRRRLPGQAVFRAGTGGPRESPAAPHGRHAETAQGRRGQPVLAWRGAGSDHAHRQRRWQAAGPDAARIRPAVFLCETARQGVFAARFAEPGLGLPARRLRTYGQHAYQPPARQDRAGPGRPAAHPDRLGPWLPFRCRRRGCGVKLNLTLTQRLSLVFAILLLACCGASAWLQIRSNSMHEKEVVQGLSRGVAESIAHDTPVMGEHGLMPEAVRRMFDQLMTVNPSVEVYLLDPHGVIIGHAAPAGHLLRPVVNLAPIHRFLIGGMLPILGDDPRSLDGKKVFSVAALRAGAHQDGPVSGYIYVVLQGEEHDRLAARVAASSVLRNTLWSMALVGLLVLVAGLVALRLITRPLHRLTETMRDFDTHAEPVELHLPATPASSGQRDEIAVLETAFGQMAGRIGEQWRTLSRQDQERRELVANISHDLRTPLGSLHGYLETLLLKDATLAPAERQRYLGIALAQSSKVGKLAQSLFELARLEHGSVEPVAEDFLLSDLIQDVFQKCELKAQSGQVSLDADMPRDANLVHADLGLIERVLTNLLDNAIRHTPAGGKVTVALRREGPQVQVTVSDTGPGIPPQLLEKLFRRPFSPGTDGRNGGLGLLIVQRILQLHGSTIELRSEPGKGAVFCFALRAAGRA